MRRAESVLSPVWRLVALLVLAAYVVLLVALLSGWPDGDGADRVPVDIGRPLVCGSFGCGEAGR